MKYISALIILLLLTSCQITETITIKPDGSGNIEVEQLRDENSYMQVVGENYSREEAFQDTTFVFQEYITKYNETFLKYTTVEQQLFKRYANVKAHLKKSSFEKEFRNTFTQNFSKVSEIADLYKTEDYANDLRHNYALTAENHYYKIEYSFDGKVFKRLVSVTNPEQLQKEKDQFRNVDPKYASLKLTQSYILQYHFPHKIKSVSNEKAIISSDKKTMTIEFKLSDCMQNPEMTSLEVVLE
ncbi:hypothetical protein NJT12_05625 [Flavobacterium sp. AC]|uniref:Lipoprotein n=1 Tax=Flavobacterium azizsancarii TaxID=2961580 RepID=A0ABT4W962_9FLAO|nr:hypothetical protein [Flavobacterium azizsancarii]MDA6069093.1 hypothetical protein [Flavobacterium azizsancarii]